ncbi:hypothetical protein IFM89_030009 [Coptis chinensis]|uniref:DUF4283 domain-containing protein n=1 Tax=Coptis chinensis TaxID=261450 RepID=A0A835IHB0_9MAGN|nr:hypothetical protein IFM89_030009 [Coptis chinensis]
MGTATVTCDATTPGKDRNRWITGFWKSIKESNGSDLVIVSFQNEIIDFVGPQHFQIQNEIVDHVVLDYNWVFTNREGIDCIGSLIKVLHRTNGRARDITKIVDCRFWFNNLINKAILFVSIRLADKMNILPCLSWVPFLCTQVHELFTPQITCDRDLPGWEEVDYRILGIIGGGLSIFCRELLVHVGTSEYGKYEEDRIIFKPSFVNVGDLLQESTMFSSSFRNGRRRSFSVVEGKSFEFEWWNNSSGAEEVSLIERGINGVFKWSVSLGAAKWLGSFLCQSSLGSIKSGPPLNFWDGYTKMICSIRSNIRGDYINMLLISRGRDSRPKTLCFPAGSDTEGWAEVGSKLLKLLDSSQTLLTRANTTGGISRFQNVPANSQRNVAGGSTESTVRSTSSPTIQVRSRGTVLNASWWSSTVICTASTSVPDWRWVKQNICVVFGQTDLRPMDGGGALVFFNTEHNANKLVSMPPLKFWEGEILFKRWNPEVGALSSALFGSKEVCLNFTGVPVHLKTPAIVELLVKECGTLVHIDELSLDCRKSKIGAKASVMDWGKIPRIINIEERGYVFPVWVEVELHGGGGGVMPPVEQGGDSLTGPVEVAGSRAHVAHLHSYQRSTQSNNEPTNGHTLSDPSRLPGFQIELEGSPLDSNFEMYIERDESFDGPQERSTLVVPNEAHLVEVPSIHTLVGGNEESTPAIVEELCEIEMDPIGFQKKRPTQQNPVHTQVGELIIRIQEVEILVEMLKWDISLGPLGL